MARNDDPALWRNGMYFGRKFIRILELLFKGSVERELRPVPVRGHDEWWVVKRAQQSPGVVVNFLSRRVRGHQSHIRPEPSNFALDVIHRAENNDLYSVQPNQKTEHAALHKVFEAQGPLDVCRSGTWVEIMLPGPETVQAWKHPYGKSPEVKIFASADSDDLI